MFHGHILILAFVMDQPVPNYLVSCLSYPAVHLFQSIGWTVWDILKIVFMMFVNLAERIRCKVLVLLKFIIINIVLLTGVKIVVSVFVVIQNCWGAVHLFVVFISTSRLTVTKTIIVTIVMSLNVPIILLGCIRSYIRLSH